MPYNNLAIRILGISRCVFAILILGLAFTLSAQTTNSSPSLKKCWEYPTTTELNERGIASDGPSVYLSERGGRVEAVSIENGQRIWYSDLGGEMISNIVADNEAVFVVTRAAGAEHEKPVLRSLSKTTGITNWAIAIPDADAIFLGLSKGDLIAVSESGLISAVSASNGSPRWMVNLNAKIVVDPDFSPDTVIAATEAREIVVLSAAKGNIVFRKMVAYQPTAVVLAGNEKGAWGDERGNLFLFSTVTQKNIWKIKHGAAISDLSDLGETLLATSNDNFAYLIAVYNGNVRWKKRQPDRIFRPALLAREMVVLSSRAGSSSTVLEKEHGRAVDTISLDAGEVLLLPPVAAGDRVLFPVRSRVLAYAPGGCSGK